MSATWPWAVIAGLGMYHGLNPAMGWLFAVALGLHRGSRVVVLQSLVPIALGHALAVAAVIAAIAALGIAVGEGALPGMAGIVLILWAIYHALYGARHRVRFGMRIGFVGLFLWSFVMAGAHGAGLMLVPAVIPLCLGGAGSGGVTSGPVAEGLLAVGVHTAAMLGVTAVIALLVYDWLGLGFLRRGWLNLDRIWTIALFATGLALLVPQHLRLW